jgi:hypothetical protein
MNENPEEQAKVISPLDLLKVNVNDHTEKKNGLTYLSWAWAWAEVLKADPKATFTVHHFEGKPYMDVNGTGMVWVSVSMFDQGRTCMLPVMDYRNKPISDPDAFQVNTAIMRCLVKTISLHGLGLYIYAGEDLPEEAAELAFKQEQQEKVEKIITKAIAKVVEGVPEEDASRELFADGMIEYADKAWHVQSTTDLQGYWKNNQVQLDALKVSHPALYEKVKNHFTELKLKFKQQKENL